MRWVLVPVVAFVVALVVSLGACVRVPDLEGAVSEAARNADFPNLVPADTITDRRADTRLRPADGPALLARAERLRQRGEILRGLPVVDEAARLRFAQTLKRLGG